MEDNNKLIIPEVIEPEESLLVYNNDVDHEIIKGKKVPTDLVYTVLCPDVVITIKKAGKRTAIRVESRLRAEGEEDPLFLEARCNTLPEGEALDKAIVKVKLAFDAIYNDLYEIEA